MTNKLSKFQAIVLGFVVLIASSIAIWQLFYKTKWEKEGIVVSAKFLEVKGLQASDRVHYRGVDVGEVIYIEPYPGYVKVTLKLSEKMNMIGMDSKVKIEKENLLKEQIVKIIEGNDSGLKTGDVLNSIEAIDPLEAIGETGKKLDDVLSQLSKNKFITDNKLYDNMVVSVDQLKSSIKETQKNVKEALDSVKEDADAIKRMPIVRNYVDPVPPDPIKELIRPNMKKVRKVFAENELFKVIKSVNPDLDHEKYFSTYDLTEEGKKKLLLTSAWLKDYKLGEIAIVSINSKTEPVVKFINQKQSEKIKEYFISKAVNKTSGWFPFNTRQIKTYGLGNKEYCEETEKLPADRIEIIVFLPVK